jgi:hypothetical protein
LKNYHSLGQAQAEIADRRSRCCGQPLTLDRQAYGPLWSLARPEDFADGDVMLFALCPANAQWRADWALIRSFATFERFYKEHDFILLGKLVK